MFQKIKAKPNKRYKIITFRWAKFKMGKVS